MQFQFLSVSPVKLLHTRHFRKSGNRLGQYPLGWTEFHLLLRKNIWMTTNVHFLWWRRIMEIFTDHLAYLYTHTILASCQYCRYEETLQEFSSVAGNKLIEFMLLGQAFCQYCTLGVCGFRLFPRYCLLDFNRNALSFQGFRKVGKINISLEKCYNATTMHFQQKNTTSVTAEAPNMEASQFYYCTAVLISFSVPGTHLPNVPINVTEYLPHSAFRFTLVPLAPFVSSR